MNLPEFRLYYDDNGDFLFYTCEKPEGNFIVVDLMTYHECRADVKVVNEELIYMSSKVISKFVKDPDGTSCHKDDISIIYDGEDSVKWLMMYERYN